MRFVAFGGASFEMLEADGKQSMHNSLWKGLSSLPGVSSQERGLDFKAFAVLTASRTMNLTHGLHASSRSGAGPRVHPIALYRRSVLVEYRHTR